MPGYIFALSTVALAFVLYLGWASFFKLNTVCMLCATTYVAVIALFIISGWSDDIPDDDAAPARREDVGDSLKSPIALVLGRWCSASARVALINAFPREAQPPAVAAAAASGRVHEPRVRRRRLTDQQKADFTEVVDVQPKVNVPVMPTAPRCWS